MIARTRSLTRAVGVPVAAAAAAGLFVATPALAGQAAVHPHAHHPHVVRGAVGRTRVPGVAVRRAPSMRSRTVAILGRAGTRITVRCWTRGEMIRRSNIWYLTTTPRAGFVPGYLLLLTHAPRGLPRC
jgi:hypothetical protein